MAFFEDLGKSVFGSLLSNYFLGGVATVVAASMLSKTLKVSGRSFFVGATKEVISFKQWLTAAVAENKEYWADVSAEAKQQYKSEVDKRLQILQRQQELLQKIKTSL